MRNSRRASRTLLPALVLSLALLSACGDDGGAARDDDGAAADAGADAAGAADVMADTGADTLATADGAGATADTRADAATDSEAADSGAAAPLAWVWVDPSQVGVADPVTAPLPHVSGEDGRLSGPFAHVSNCLNEPGGVETTQMVNGSPMTLALCNVRQTVTRNADGDYLDVTLPTNWKNPDDPFAEVQMYYHVNRVHDWFAERHGFTGMDRPLQAIVNLQVGLKVGNTVWLSIDNAAFMPEESVAELGELIGVAPPIEGDAIIFAQGPELDLSYDGDVVYHEYTHAVIGGDRLFGVRKDAYGPDYAPLSINEALADYFTASITDDPAIGGWSLGTLGALRDLSEARRCPDHVIGESHWDGQVYSSALWAVREALGAETTDAIVFDALLTHQQLTGFDEAAEAVIANAAALDPPHDAEVAAIFARHGLPGCDRVVPAEAETLADRVFLPGTRTTGDPAFDERAPAYAQASFAVDEGTRALTITWERAPDGLDGLLGLFGYEAPPVELSLALKRGGDAIRWTYGDDGTTHDADALVPVRREGGGEADRYVVTVAGSCLTPGRHVLQIVNDSEGGAAMRRPRVTPLAELPPGGSDEGIAGYDCE